METISKSDAEWEQQLTSEQYRVLRKKGTEPPFRNVFCNNHDRGVYRCAGCDLELFQSDAKFDSGTGWPSFFKATAEDQILNVRDESHGMERTEVLCARCHGHLGHLFPDGPAPSNLRYCINSASLKFDKAE